jgi:hypothetical protein
MPSPRKTGRAELLHFLATHPDGNPSRFADLMRAVVKVKPEAKKDKPEGKRRKKSN